MELPMESSESIQYGNAYPPTLLLGMPLNEISQHMNSNNEVHPTSPFVEHDPVSSEQSSSSSTVIEDISNNTKYYRELHDAIDNHCTPKSDEEELRELLKSWNQEHLFETLVNEKVFVNALKVIRLHHIERLLKGVDMGTQILFENSLVEWRQLMGIPIQDRGFGLGFSPSIPNQGGQTTSPSPSYRYSPYPSSPTPPNAVGIKVPLSQILNESPKAAMLIQYYEKFKKFDEEQRSMLVAIISSYFEHKGITMSLTSSYRLEEEIINRFPTETLEFYRTSKRGKLYNKWRNSLAPFKHAITKHIATNSAAKKENRTSRKILNCVPEADAEEKIRSLKFDNLSSEEFDYYWKACSQHRLNEIKSLESTSQILENWPFYKQPSGFRLIDMDFTVGYENCDGLVTCWEGICGKILEFLSNGNVKDKTIKSLLQKLNDQDVNENGRHAAVLLAMHGYFVPTGKSIRKDILGKRQTTKYTIQDSQQSFLYVAKNTQEIEEWLNVLKSKKTAIQPFVFGIGEDVGNIKEIYTYFDGIKYKFFNIIRAVDICFKIFYIFNLNFPEECIMFWSFMESYFYKMKPSATFSKIHVLCNFLEGPKE